MNLLIKFQFAVCGLVCCLLVACTDKNIDEEGPPAPNILAWLDENTNVQQAIKLEEEADPSYFFGGTLTELEFTDWSGADKAALVDSFERAWHWLYVSQQKSILGIEEFSMPLRCTFCESRLLSHPTYGPFTVIPESLSKRAYIAYVAHSLALEVGEGVAWSILGSSASELHHFFNSRSMMHRSGGATEFFFGEPGGGGDARIKYLGRVSPATPIYVYRWFVNNDLLKPTHEETIHAVLKWLRDNAVHFYGAATYSNMEEHWGYPAQTSAYDVIRGTVRTGESSAQHWTAGCHGTAGFVKSVMKAVNIPVEVIYTCGHAQLYFPTIDRYLDHGDNPYNANVRTNPQKDISGILISPATHSTWFSASPDYLLSANPLCDNIGRAAQEF